MAIVKKANVVLEIEDEEIEKYFEKGFSVLDDSGKVIKESIPTEVAELQKLVADQKAIITELEEQIKNLKKVDTKVPEVVEVPQQTIEPKVQNRKGRKSQQ